MIQRKHYEDWRSDREVNMSANPQKEQKAIKDD